MPIYEFDLSDGTTVTVESETEPTDEQVLGTLQTQEVPVEEPRFTQNLGQVLSAPQPELPPQTIPYTGIPESMAPRVDWERFQAGPTLAEERTTGVPSATGLTPEIVPPGTEIAKSKAFPAIRPFLGLAGMVAPETAATIASSAAKTGIGISEYLTSPQGVTELVGSMSPARLLVFGKWFVDMAKGTFEEAGTLSALLAKPNKTQEDWQAISDHTVSGIAMFLGAAGAGYKTGKIAAGYLPKGGKIKVEDRSELINRMEEELRASRQAQEGSPFVRAQAPPELSLPPGVQGPPAAFPISMGFRIEPPLATDITFTPSGRVETFRETFEPSGLRMAGRGELPVPPDVARLQPPSPTIAPPTPSGRAAQVVRLKGEAAQRMADWEKAMAEKVAKEQEQPAHPNKPLTENQLRIIRESLEKQILEGQIPGERKGFIVGSALEAWADGVIKQGPKMTNMGVDPKLAAAVIVKGAALLERGITNAAEWTAAMIREHGEGIRPFLGQIRRDAEQVRARTFTQKPLPIPPEVQAAGTPPTPPVTKAKGEAEASKPEPIAINVLDNGAKYTYYVMPTKTGYAGFFTTGEGKFFQAVTKSFQTRDAVLKELAQTLKPLPGRGKISFYDEKLKEIAAPEPAKQKSEIGLGENLPYGLTKLDIEQAGGIKEAIEAANERANRESIRERASDVYEWNTKSKRWGQVWTEVKQDPVTKEWRVIGGMEGNLRGLDVARFTNEQSARNYAKDFREGKNFALLNNDRWIRMVDSSIQARRITPSEEALLKSRGRETGSTETGATIGKPELQNQYEPIPSAKVESPPAEPPGAPSEKVVELVKDPTRMDGVLRSKAGDVTLRAPVAEHPNGGYVVNQITAFVQPGVLENVFKNRPQVTIQVTEPIRGKTAQEARNLAYEKLADEINTGKFEMPAEAAPDLISKLESLKLPETGGGNLYTFPHPDAIKAIGRSTWNTAIDVAIASVKAGKAIAQAVDDAIAYLRKNVRGLDEVKARANLEYVTREETRPTTAPTPATAIEFPEASRPVVDPITGEPGKVITEAAARSMESKVKLSSQVDVDKLKAQLELFDKEIGDALESGGQFLPKEMRPEVAKGAPAERKTVTNKEINQYFVNKLSSIRKQMQATRLKILREADIDSQVYYDSLQKQFEKAFKQIQELRRTSHESLYFWNKIRAEYQEIARAAGRMPEIKRQMPIINQILKDVREKSFQQAGRHFADFLRLNLFTPGSWTLDFTTNFVAAANRLPAWAIMDTGSFIAGTPSARLLTATRALANNMKNWNPFGKRFRLPDQIETELGTTMAGEFGGSPRQVMIDFKEYLPNHPKLAEKLNYLDLLIAGQVRMKRAVDSFFGRFGAAAELYNRAYTEGRLRGLKGDELKQFSEDFVQNPPETAIASAVKTGKEIKFNRDLSNVEERFASSLGMKLFVEAFPRWTFQFMRWGGEMIGVDPKFFKDFVTGKATAEQTVTYLTKAATGWGGIYAFNQLFYDNIDEQTMEYVKENGDRVRLAGRTPAPELFFICALLRGDTQTAKLALPYLSLPLAKLVGGEPGGLLSSMIDTFRESLRGRYTAEQTARELNNLVNNAIPGKSMLGLIRSFYDPTIREGIGAPIPGVASLLPQPVDPTTGEPRAPKQRIPGIPIDIPTVGGTPFPGATRVLNNIETALLNHRLGLRRPRRTSIIELPAEDVPKEVRREYEVAVANYVKEFVGGVITDPEFKAMEYEDRRNLLQKMMEAARLNAKYDLADKYGTTAEPTLSTPLLLRRVPERMRTPAAPAP